MTPFEWVGIIAGAVAAILTIAAIAGMIWARVRSSADETTAALWKGEAEAQKARADRLEAVLADLARRVELLEDENRTLRALHDSREEMAQLRHAMTDGFMTLANLLKEGH